MAVCPRRAAPPASQGDVPVQTVLRLPPRGHGDPRPEQARAVAATHRPSGPRNGPVRPRVKGYNRAHIVGSALRRCRDRKGIHGPGRHPGWSPARGSGRPAPVRGLRFPVRHGLLSRASARPAEVTVRRRRQRRTGPRGRRAFQFPRVPNLAASSFAVRQRHGLAADGKADASKVATGEPRGGGEPYRNAD